MGTYNILSAEVECANCCRRYNTKIQFKFGDTRQYEYELGDIIKWNSNDVGFANLTAVKVYGVGESMVCPYCGYMNKEEFDILITHDRIVDVTEMRAIRDYDNDTERNYSII